MLHPLQFAAMYKNLCTLEENALINETPVEMVSVDTDKAMELLRGAGIYEGAYQCIREVLQNAVDATLLRKNNDEPL